MKYYNLKIPSDLYLHFKARCKSEGKTIKYKMYELIKDYTYYKYQFIKQDKKDK